MMTPTFLTEQIRTRITCSKREGKEKSVKTAIERYFRIDKSIWIKSKPGKFLLRKNLFIKILKLHLFYSKKKQKLHAYSNGWIDLLMSVVTTWAFLH